MSTRETTGAPSLDEGGEATTAPEGVWAATDSCCESLSSGLFLGLHKKGK